MKPKHLDLPVALVVATLVVGGCTGTTPADDPSTGATPAATAGVTSTDRGTAGTATGTPSDEADVAGEGSEPTASESATDDVVAPELRPARGDVDDCTRDGDPVPLAETVVGFSQFGTVDDPFRAAVTTSITDRAAAVGAEDVVATDAGSDLATQESQVRDLLDGGVELLVVAPAAGRDPQSMLDEARDRGVPVIVVGPRSTPGSCEDRVTSIGSDVRAQGRRAGEQLVEATGGDATVAILLGPPGDPVTTDRTDGFARATAAEDGVAIVAQQTGNATREGGRQVAAQLLASNPDIDAVYAQDDEMALGALQALRDADLTPGEDVRVVAIGGSREAVQAVADGEIVALVESNPRFGPLVLEVARRYLQGDPIPSQLVVEDGLYTPGDAVDQLDRAY